MLLVRHGDENPPTPPKNNTRVVHSTHWAALEEDSSPYLKYMKYINVKEIESGKLINKLDTKTFFNKTAPAQLTKRGFMQSIKLGQFLAERYALLLRLVTSPNQVYVRSSNSDRALQSVAAVLTGMLSPLLNATSRLTVRYFGKFHHEVMMGVGDNTGHDPCSVVIDSIREQQQIFRSKNRDISMAVSASQTAYCNNEPLFCPVIEGSAHCLTPNKLAVLKTMNDRTMCQMHAGSMGGLRASELKAGPFMQDLKRHLTRAMQITQTSASPERLVIYEGHSSVVQLALVGLGVYRHICANPAFGARVTFEVWHRNISPTKESRAASRQLKHDNSKTKSFVRILYDGQDITHLVPSCVMKAEPDEVNWIDNRKLKEVEEPSRPTGHGVLCPLDRLFLHFDSGTKAQYDYLPEDCKKTYTKSYNRYNNEFSKDL
jgi:hypothetical protein